MRAQVVAHYCFYLECGSTGQLSYHFEKGRRIKAAPPPLWTEHVQLKLPPLCPTAPAREATLHLATNAECSSHAPLPPSQVPRDGATHYRGSLPLIKSALQKHVRRCNVPAAVACCWWLLQEDASELLRRLSLICVEDAMLHPSLPCVVWLMAAHAKGYRLQEIHAHAMLQVAHDLASLPIRDEIRMPAGAPRGKWQPEAGTLRADGTVDTDGMHPGAAVLVQSLLIRSVYGGMKGDVQMLGAAVSLWRARFLSATPPPPSGEQPWLQWMLDSYLALPRPYLWRWGCLGELPALQEADVGAAAVDFHVSDILPELMKLEEIVDAAGAAYGKTGRWPDDCLKTAMWRHRSGVNHKESIHPPTPPAGEDVPAAEGDADVLETLWRAVEPQADAYSTRFIRKKFSL